MEEYIFDKRKIKKLVKHYGLLLLIALPLAIFTSYMIGKTEMHRFLQVFILCLVLAGQILLFDILLNIKKSKNDSNPKSKKK